MSLLLTGTSLWILMFPRNVEHFINFGFKNTEQIRNIWSPQFPNTNCDLKLVQPFLYDISGQIQGKVKKAEHYLFCFTNVMGFHF